MTVISDAGPPISQDAIVQLETTLGTCLPTSYRSFLLKYNGGCPEPSLVDIEGWSGSPTDVGYFFGIGRIRPQEDIYHILQMMNAGYPGHPVLPIASDYSSDIFCFDFSEYGKVPVLLYESWGAHQETAYRPLHVANSFEDLLAKLYDADLEDLI